MVYEIIEGAFDAGHVGMGVALAVSAAKHTYDWGVRRTKRGQPVAGALPQGDEAREQQVLMLASALDGVNQRLNGLDQAVGELRGQLDTPEGYESPIEYLADRVDTLAMQVSNEVDDSLALAKRVESIETNGIEDMLARERVDQLIKDVHEFGDNLRAHREAQGQHTGGDLRSQQVQHGTALEDHAHRIAAHGASIKVLRDQADRAMAALEARLDAQSQIAHGIDARIDALRDHPKGLAGWQRAEREGDDG